MLGAQIPAAGLSLALFLFVFLATPKEERRFRAKPDPYLFFVGAMPLLVLTAVFSLGAVRGSTRLAYAFMGYVPLLLFSCFPGSPPAGAKRRAVALTYVVMGIMGLGFLCKVTLTFSLNDRFDGRLSARVLKERWDGRYRLPLRYVGGGSPAADVSIYLAERPRFFFDLRRERAPWIDVEDVRAHGMLVVARSREEYAAYGERYPQLTEPAAEVFTMRNILGTERRVTVYYGFLPPEGEGRGAPGRRGTSRGTAAKYLHRVYAAPPTISGRWHAG